MDNLLFIGNLGTGEIIIIAIIVLLLFGGKKIPELMKGLGKGVKNFKDGVKGIEDDIKIDDTDTTNSTNTKKLALRHDGRTTRRNVVLGPPGRTSLDFIPYHPCAFYLCDCRVLVHAVVVRPCGDGTLLVWLRDVSVDVQD